jgi:hypothetical protein
MAFHEKAGPGQVDFDVPFLKFPFLSWREGRLRKMTAVTYRGKPSPLARIEIPSTVRIGLLILPGT